MTPEELERYLENIVDDLDGSLIEKPSDTYYQVDVTRLEEAPDDADCDVIPVKGAKA